MNTVGLNTATRGISVFWAGASTTSAPSASVFPVGTIGANADGATTGETYHVVQVAGTATWIATGGTVAHFYGVAPT